jgi:PST family polysaccharide transporter
VTPVATREVRRLAVQGVGATTLFQVLGVASQMAATVVLARLLRPEDFGVVTMVTTFSLLLLNAAGNGLTEAVLQRERLDHPLASNIFWLAVATGSVCSVLLVAAGPFIAWLFGEPRVTLVAAALSPSIFLTSLGVLHQALLMRVLRFRHVYSIAAVGRLSSIVVAVILAWNGWGYWALVAGPVAQAFCESAALWTLCRWTPGPPRTLAETWAMARFALHVYGRFSFNYLARNIDNALVGWRFDAQVLGYYKKAFDLFAFSSFFASFSSVAVSALSRFRRDAAQYRKYVLNIISMAAFLGVGTGAVLCLAGKDLIRLILGAGWDPAGEVFVYFAPGVAATFVYGVHGWIHLSSGTPDKWFRWGVVEFLVTFASFLVGLHWGAVGVAAASSAAATLLVLPGLWYAGRSVRLGIGELGDALWRYVLAGLLAVASTMVLAGQAPELIAGPPWLTIAARMAANSITFAVVYVVAVVAICRSVEPVRQVLTLVMEAFGASPGRRGPLRAT